MIQGAGGESMADMADAPSAVTDWRWQWVFPSYTMSVDPRTGWRGRHHLHEGTVSRELSQAGWRG